MKAWFKTCLPKVLLYTLHEMGKYPLSLAFFDQFYFQE